MNIEIEIPLDVYFCPKCKILYHSSKDYIRVEHLGSIESKYKCNTCGEQFYNNQSFKNQKLIFRLNESILKKYNLYLNTEIRKYVTEYLNILTTNLLKIEPYSARDIARITKFNLKRIQPFYNTYKKEYQTPNRDKINKEFINIIDIDARNWIVDNNYDEKYNALKSDRAKQKILIMALLKIGCSTEVIRIFFDDNKPQTKEISEIRKNIFKRNKNPKLRYIIKNGYISQKVSIVNIHKYFDMKMHIYYDDEIFKTTILLNLNHLDPHYEKVIYKTDIKLIPTFSQIIEDTFDNLALDISFINNANLYIVLSIDKNEENDQPKVKSLLDEIKLYDRKTLENDTKFANGTEKKQGAKKYRHLVYTHYYIKTKNSELLDIGRKAEEQKEVTLKVSIETDNNKHE